MAPAHLRAAIAVFVGTAGCDTVALGFDRPGRYEALGGIRPEMRLPVSVEAAAKP